MKLSCKKVLIPVQEPHDDSSDRNSGAFFFFLLFTRLPVILLTVDAHFNNNKKKNEFNPRGSEMRSYEKNVDFVFVSLKPHLYLICLLTALGRDRFIKTFFNFRTTYKKPNSKTMS